ncbi:hypothetical protein RM553_19445 [Zunongwangia sp. F363]|uniref:GIY-YIG domain-containing protein n=1 Tax=Autumnicola tepida TaxID=3075595 RepID=A0ABU3CFD6_9FLAO|nr:hypothetical protein [Zunongwangia sp. F363]MDT0645016.1 hypothetical protein [Zunongwangia sp. F363]
MELGSFKISGHSTKREWSVYLFVAKPKKEKDKIKLYVGKVGDNRAGCNPVISRVGNHFSHNKVHSQIRNAIKETVEYDYEYFYCHCGEYKKEDKRRSENCSRINELERELNRVVQNQIENKQNFELLNPYKGNHISKLRNKKRSQLINDEEREVLSKLVETALTTTTVNRQ